MTIDAIWNCPGGHPLAEVRAEGDVSVCTACGRSSTDSPGPIDPEVLARIDREAEQMVRAGTRDYDRPPMHGLDLDY